MLYRSFLNWYRDSSLCLETGSGVHTPVDALFRHLQLRGRLPESRVVLDVFGGNGLFKTLDISRGCEHLTHFEIEESLSLHAQKVLPRDRTEFRIEDSIKAIQEGRLPRQDYNFVHIDNVPGLIGERYCENFDLFPAIFDSLGDRAVLVFNAFLDVNEYEPEPEWLERRQTFFGLDSPDAARSIDFEALKRGYQSKIPKSFELEEMFPVPHAGQTIYLVLCVKRCGDETQSV